MAAAAAASDDALAELLHPVTPAQFEESYWEKAALHIADRSTSSLHHRLLTAAELPALAAALAAADVAPQVFRDGERRPSRAPLQDFLQGGSLIVNRVDKLWPPIGRLCAALRRRLHHAFAVLYLTPRGSQAVRVHTDDQDVFVLQLAGSKEWRVYDAPQPLPYEDEQLGKDAPYDRARLGTPTLAATLRPGSLLYLPRGMLHEARAGDDGGSLHVTITVQTSDMTWGGFVADALRAVHRRHLDFRRALPLDVPIELGARGDGAESEAEGSAALQPRWEALMALTAAEADRGFEAAYAALCAKLRRHNDEQDAAVRAAAAAAAARPTPPLPPRLRLAAGLRVAAAPDGDGGDGRWHFARGGQTMSLGLPPHLTPAVRALCSADGCEWAAAPEADELERAALAGRLLELGVVEAGSSRERRK